MIQLLTGDNDFAVLEKQKQLTEQFLTEYDGFGLERLDGEDLDESALRSAVLQMPFLVSKKLVIIRSLFANKHCTEFLLAHMDEIPEEIDVLLVDTKADKRTRLYKELSGRKMVSEFTKLKGSALEKWASDYAISLGAKLSPQDAHYLVERVGDDQMRLAREIEKLAYAGVITTKDIDELTEKSLRSTVFDLLDRTFAGRTKDALSMYDELLANKTDPSEVLALIAWQLHVLALIKYAGEGSSSEVASKTGLHPYVVGKAIYIARGLSVAQIKASVSQALETDILIKTTATDSADAVKVLLLDLSTL